MKTAAQALLTLFGTATMFQQVDWAQAPTLIGTAVLGSLVISFLGFLPEAQAPDATFRTDVPAGAQVGDPQPVVITNNIVPATAAGDGRDAG